MKKIIFIIILFLFVSYATAQTVQKLVPIIKQAWAGETIDIMQLQDPEANPVLRVTYEGNLVLPIGNVTTSGKQIEIANTSIPGASDDLYGMKIDYTGIDLDNDPDLYGEYIALPGTYGSGTEAGLSVNGDGRTAILASDFEAGYFSDGTRYFRACTWNSSFQADGLGILNNNYQMNVDVNDVSNPPTDAELDSIYGSVNDGFTAYIDDNGEGSNFYQVVYRNSAWYIFTGTKAS